MKIYYQYSTIKKFKPTKGDFINEFNTILALSQFADVYYSGNKFVNDESKDYGMEDYSGPITNKCLEDDYDAYIVRANKKLFKKIKSKNKFWIASPYNKECFDSSKAIITFTSDWKNILKKGKVSPLNPEGKKYDNVITFHQTLNPLFKPLQSDARAKKFRRHYGDGFIVGYFGKVKDKDRIESFVRIINKLNENDIETKFVLASKNKRIERDNVINMSLEYFDVPYALSACDVAICEGVSSVGGKLKVIEAMACGTPIIVPRFRVEQLGKGYPLLYDRMPDENNRYILSDATENQIYEMITKCQSDESFLNRISKRIVKKAEFYSLENSAKRKEAKLSKLIE